MALIDFIFRAKQKLAAGALAVSLLTLCACGGTAAPNKPGATPGGSTPASPVTFGTFSMLTRPVYLDYGSDNSLGYYRILRSDTGSLLNFTDYKTHQSVCTCSQPNCEHNSETCSAWFPPDYLDMVVAPAEDKLFFLLTCVKEGEEGNIIQMADLDGGNRKTIYSAASGRIMSNMVAYDGQNLVIGVSCVSEEHPELASPIFKLLCLNVESGETTEIFSLDKVINLSKQRQWDGEFLGVTDDGFLVKVAMQGQYTIDDESLEKSLTAMEKAQRTGIYRVPFDGSEPQEIITSYGAYNFKGFLYKSGFFYSIKNPDGTVSLHRRRGDNDIVLIADVKQAMHNTEEALSASDVYFWEDIDDEHIMLSVLTSQYNDQANSMIIVYTGAAMNIETGELTVIELNDYYAATYSPVYIMARHDDQLLVRTRRDNTKGSGLIETFYLISADDFLHSRPNYIPIEAIA